MEIRITSKKYFQVFKTVWQNTLVYRLNFLMWRIRNFLLMVTTYFIWLALFNTSGQQTLFAYQKQDMITYVLMVAILSSIVLTSRTIDLAWIINSGDLSDLLVKPLSIQKYFFSQDLADKALNFIFFVGEFVLFLLLFSPDIILKNSAIFVFFLPALILAVVLYFYINFFLSLLGFWTNQVWAARFLFTTVFDVLAGSIFPLDILPSFLYKIVTFLPFNFLIFFPIQIYLERISKSEIITGIITQLAWILVFYLLVKIYWKKGMKRYVAEGN